MDESLLASVRRAQQRDPDAFAALLRAHERMALAIAYGVLRDPHAAGDVAQDAFLRAWQRIDTLDDPARFGPWLAAMVRNLALDAQRRLRLAPPPPESPGEPDPAEAASRQELLARVGDAVRELDEPTRMIVMLRYFDQRDSKAIAALLGLSPAAVDMRLARAREKLRQLLSPTLRPS